MKIFSGIRQYVIVLLALSAAMPVFLGQTTESKILHATAYNSHFPEAGAGGEAFNGLSVASNGTVYYVISSGKFNIPGEMYSLNPKTKVITHLSNLNDATGQGDIKAVAQGKSHVTFVEDNGKLYFSTHLGFAVVVSGVERQAPPPDNYRPYPGGHFLSYDMKTGKFESLGIAPLQPDGEGEGIQSFNMDVQRGRMYGLIWPSGRFISYDLKSKQLKDLGTAFVGGESGTLGGTYRTLCRRIVIDPQDGSAYFTTPDGIIHRYHYDMETVEAVAGVDLKKDYFGLFDPTGFGMGYSWRAAVWVPAENAIYGVNGRSGYLFRFDPRVPSVEVLGRLTSEASQMSGMYDSFVYGNLGLALGADGHTLYYLTAGPLADRAAAAAASPIATPNGPEQQANRRRLAEGLHLVTYDISTSKYVDHGQIVLDNDNGAPAGFSQALAVGRDGTVYALSSFVQGGKRRTDLISFHP
jgi:hypothetical protein